MMIHTFAKKKQKGISSNDFPAPFYTHLYPNAVGIKLNTAKKIVDTSHGISRSFLWKHEKDGTINPVLPQFHMPYGIKRSVGEKELHPTRVSEIPSPVMTVFFGCL